MDIDKQSVIFVQKLCSVPVDKEDYQKDIQYLMPFIPVFM